MNTTPIKEHTEQIERPKEGRLPEAPSLRDYFAAKAIPMVAERFSFSRGDINGEYIAVESFESIAFDAYLMADAMLKERAK